MKKMISLLLAGCVVVAGCGIYAMMLSDDKEFSYHTEEVKKMINQFINK